MSSRRTMIAILMMLSAGCAREGSSPLYEAEKDLYTARKQARELTFPTLNNEFLEIALDSYRRIIEKYGGTPEDPEGLDKIVLTARMELAQLEFRASMFDAAREEFMRAYETAGDAATVRANALWSAALISRESGDIAEARRLFSRFHEEFLGPDTILATAEMNRRYLLTPIRIAEMCADIADERCSEEWLGRAEEAYGMIMRSDASEELKKETRYNLVTTHLLSRDWSSAMAEIQEMKDLYRDEADIPSLLYVEAKIAFDGLKDRGRALAIFDEIVENHPVSKEAPVALLMTGNIHLEAGDFDKAAQAYSRVIGEYGGGAPETVEATWQMAILEEKRGNWAEASLHYKSVYTNYPTTIQGMEAPLRIAAHYRGTGEKEALSAAYERAIDHYRHLASIQFEVAVRIIAEEYHVRTLVEQERWEEAAERLLVLPGMYPQYHRFKNNCLMAASIIENNLGDPDRAAEILRNCASKYSGTPLAEEARRQFERIEGVE